MKAKHYTIDKEKYSDHLPIKFEIIGGWKYGYRFMGI